MNVYGENHEYCKSSHGRLLAAAAFESPKKGRQLAWQRLRKVNFCPQRAEEAGRRRLFAKSKVNRSVLVSHEKVSIKSGTRGGDILFTANYKTNRKFGRATPKCHLTRSLTYLFPLANVLAQLFSRLLHRRLRRFVDKLRVKVLGKERRRRRGVFSFRRYAMMVKKCSREATIRRGQPGPRATF